MLDQLYNLNSGLLLALLFQIHTRINDTIFEWKSISNPYLFQDTDISALHFKCSKNLMLPFIGKVTTRA